MHDRCSYHLTAFAAFSGGATAHLVGADPLEGATWAAIGHMFNFLGHDGKERENPETEGKFGTYIVFDRAGGYDHKLSKEEADLWCLWGNGRDLYVDNSYIDWSGLEIPNGIKVGDIFGISTTDAFIKLPYFTASTYGGTSFKVTGPNTVEVLDQMYHYKYRKNNSIQNVLRNMMTWYGKPSYYDTGKPFMIRYYNREIKLD